MAKRSWLIQQHQNALEVVCIDQSGDIVGRVNCQSDSLGNEETASAIAEIFHDNGFAGEDVMLAVASRECLVAQFPIESGVRSKSAAHDESIYYQLEEQLPISAEDVVADFHPRSQQVFAVAIRIQRWCSFALSLRDSGVTITSICPYALLVAQALAIEQELRWAEIAIEFGKHTDVVQVRDGGPSDWFYSAFNSIDLRSIELADCLGGSDVAETNSATPDDQSSLAKRVEVTLRGEDDSDGIFQTVCRFVDVVNHGRMEPWIQLAKRELQVADTMRAFRLPLNAVAAATVLLATVLAGSLWYRTSDLSSRVAQVQSEQGSLFREVMPNQRIPVGIRARLRSEFRNLQGLAGSGGSTESEAEIVGTLAHVLSHLPQDLRFRLIELRIDGNEFFLEGETRSHGDADQVAAKLQSDGYEFGPVTTQQLSGDGVSFRLDGKVEIARTTDG